MIYFYTAFAFTYEVTYTNSSSIKGNTILENYYILWLLVLYFK